MSCFVARKPGSWVLVQAERVGAQSYLALTKQLADETELVVWKSVIDALREIDNLARGSVGRPASPASRVSPADTARSGGTVGTVSSRRRPGCGTSPSR